MESKIHEIQFGEYDESKYDAEEGVYDLIINNMTIHWNDSIEDSFKNFHRMLKPDGACIVSLLGNDTL